MRIQHAFSKVPSGIAGFKGRDPIQVAVTIGRKHPTSGQPVEKDRFYLMDPRLTQREFRKRGGGTYKSEARELSPSFAEFNRLGPGGQSVLHGNLAHATEEFWTSGYVARNLTGGATGTKIPGGGIYGQHPNKWPVCRGNGETAARWTGGDQAIEIPCLGDGCRFRDSGDCLVFSELTFRLRWPGADFPALLARWSCKSWHSTTNLVGMVRHYESICEGAGIEPIYFGLPFTMTLGEKRSAEKKAVFPVVTFAIDGDVLDIIGRQQQALSATSRGAVAVAAPSRTPKQLAASLAETYVDDESDGADEAPPEMSAIDARVLLRDAVKEASRGGDDAKAEAARIGAAVSARSVELFGVEPGECGQASQLLELRAWVVSGMPSKLKKSKPGSSTELLAARLRPTAHVAVDDGEGEGEEDPADDAKEIVGGAGDDDIDRAELESYAIAFSDLAGWDRQALDKWCMEKFGKAFNACVKSDAAALDAKLEEMAEGE